MLVPVNHIVGLTSIIRERYLPISGTVLVHPGQKVSPMDVIAETHLSRKHVRLEVARILKLSPASADRRIKCSVGDELAAGAEIAVGTGVFPRSVRTPREGRVAAVGGGQVLLETGDTKLEVRAVIPGTVIGVVAHKGAVVQTSGALIQGIWGNGRVDSGLLVNLNENPDGVLAVEKIDVNLRGSILLGGMLKDPAVLDAAAALPVRGLILSSMPASLIQKACEMNYPILVTDGFGPLPMNSAAYRLLSTNAKRDVVILNAEIFDRYTGARPEAIIPLPISIELPVPNEIDHPAVGMFVRMRRPPFMGRIGSIVSIKPGLTSLPSGLRAPAAEIKLENNEIIIVPLVNLEVVG